MLKEILQILKDSVPIQGSFWWVVYLPTILLLLLGLGWIVFLFPEWKKDVILLFFLFVSLVVASAGIFSISCGIVMARKVDWQIESGVVVSSFIKKNTEMRSTIDSRSLSGIVSSTYFVPYISCKYSVDGEERGNYSRFYTRQRVVNEQITTLTRLIEMAQNSPDSIISYGGELFEILENENRLGEAKNVIEKIRSKFPEQFNASYLRKKLPLDSMGRK
jgi:hypothetical protein